jgi:uncharacterized protein (TIGR00299 family) protein
MKTLYLDCGMGAAGDMLTAALMGLTDDREAALEELNRAFAGKAVLSLSPDRKGSLHGLHCTVSIDGDVEGQEEKDHHHHHHHTSLAEVEAFIGSLRLPEKAVADALAVFRLIAEAEGKVHGSTMENIHFHELGTLDAMADVVSVCYLMHLLKPDRVAASPVHVGSGTVRTAHGELSVPAPATMELRKGIPIYAGETRGELCTPTGAALLKHFVDRFGTMPAMSVEKIGYGTGTKEFPQANILRALLGDAEDEGERLLELSCNLDDSTPEDLGYAMEALFQAGALDVWYTPIGMKKSRPAVRVAVLCRPDDREKMLTILFRHTQTIGVRETLCQRYVLRREAGTVESPWGAVRVKRSEGWGVERVKAEADDLARIARENNLSLAQVRRNLQGL